MNEVTPEDVHNVAFSNPARGRRGYHEDEVDDFLGRIEATLRDPRMSGAVTSAEVENVSFSKPPIGARGYNEDEVDALLGRIAIQLGGRAAPDPGPRHLRHTDESTAQTILDHIRAFVAEFSPTNHYRFTWRTPLVIGLVFVFLGFAVHPAYYVVGAGLLICAAVAWYSRWGG
jgi:DivIVA domain-containing protein